ncbi:hypothetical protein [Micromonospora okii]|uniref:hypothetical protein n=1 Tax=Micromonospora okii TaxID=1182970 RepID=UPI001E51BCCF|nr:hypothetical protein [Micromonospora okii]
MSIYVVLIDGWDQRSAWFCDDGTRSSDARLTRNSNSDDNRPYGKAKSCCPRAPAKS